MRLKYAQKHSVHVIPKGVDAEEEKTSRRGSRRTLNAGSDVEQWILFQQKERKIYFPLSLTHVEFYTTKLKGTWAQILNPLCSDRCHDCNVFVSRWDAYSYMLNYSCFPRGFILYYNIYVHLCEGFSFTLIVNNHSPPHPPYLSALKLINIQISARETSMRTLIPFTNIYFFVPEP